jgi:hypothetical protein
LSLAERRASLRASLLKSTKLTEPTLGTSFATRIPRAPTPAIASQKLSPFVAATTATLRSLFRDAAGLKNTGEVGGGTSSRLAFGTTSRVFPSRYSEVITYTWRKAERC